jgi:hypothetical protein
MYVRASTGIGLGACCVAPSGSRRPFRRLFHARREPDSVPLRRVVHAQVDTDFRDHQLRVAARIGLRRLLRASARGSPHSPQNRSRGSMVAPHEGQVAGSPAPHWTQNFGPTRFSCLQGRAEHLRPSLEATLRILGDSRFASARGRRAQLRSGYFPDGRRGCARTPRLGIGAHANRRKSCARFRTSRCSATCSNSESVSKTARIRRPCDEF